MVFLKINDLKTTLIQFLVITAVTTILAYGASYNMLRLKNESNVQLMEELISPVSCSGLKDEDYLFDNCKYVNKEILKNKSLESDRLFLKENTFFAKLYINFEDFLNHDEKIVKKQLKYTFKRNDLSSIYSKKYAESQNLIVTLPDNAEEIMLKMRNEIVMETDVVLKKYRAIITNITSVKSIIISSLFALFLYKFFFIINF